MLRIVASTRSPGRSPAARSAAAALPIRPRASAYVNDSSPATSHTLSGTAATASSNSSGIVSGMEADHRGLPRPGATADA